MTNRERYQLNNLSKMRYHVHEINGVVHTRVLYKGRTKVDIPMPEYNSKKGELLKQCCTRKLYQWLDCEYSNGE